MKQVRLAESAEVDVIVAVVVVVADGRTEAVERDRKSGLRGDIGERAVAVVVVKVRRGCAVLGMSGEIGAIDEQDVGVAVVVVIDERATRAHCFWKPLFAESSVIVREAQSGLGGDVAEVDGLGLGK